MRNVFLGLLMAGCGVVGAADLSGIYSKKSPVIDGRLDDAIWRQAPVIADFRRPDGKPLERRTEARIVYTDTAIIFGFKAFVRQNELVAEKSARDKSVTNSDCVEIMIDPAGGADGYKHLVVNAAHGILDRVCEQGGFVGDEKWDGEWTSAVVVMPEFWSTEISIPYRTLGIPARTGEFWSLNLCRESFGSPTAPREISSIAAGAFNVAGDFRRLTAPAVDLSAYKLSLDEPATTSKLVDGKLELSVTGAIRELAGKPRDLRAECVMVAADGKAVARNVRFKMAADGKQELKFAPLVLDKPGRYKGKLTVRNHGDNRILARREFSCAADYLPMRVTLVDPHYRNAIFATQELDKVRYTVTLDVPAEALAKATLTGTIREAGAKNLVTQTVPAAAVVTFEFANAALPEGRLEVINELRNGDGKIIATTMTPLRKLARRDGEVWRDKQGIWRRNGKKLFLNACWNRVVDYYPDYNIVLGDLAGEYSDRLSYSPHPFLGLAAIKDDLKRGLVTDKVREFYRKKVEMRMNDPRTFGHFLCDEPDIAGYTRESFEIIYRYIVDLDPYHPVVICPGSSGVTDFANTAEISAFHCYPRVARDRTMANFDKIVYFMDKANAYFATLPAAPTITYTHQGFDYSDSGNTNTRVPTYEELRNQDLLTLILGGNGFLHYNRCSEQYPELYIGMPALVREQKIIGEEAIIQDDMRERIGRHSPNLRVLAKANTADGSLWLLVCNTSYDSGEYFVEFPPFRDSSLQVLSEKRAVKAVAGRVVDRFTPFQVHVYTTSQKDYGVRNIADVNREIAAVYTARRAENKDNLAYQEHENDTVKVSASSNRWPIFRAENSLWHIADGVSSGTVGAGPHSYGVVIWHDATPRKTPDWITLEFPKPTLVGRVEVYPAENSLANYEIQALVDGQFKTVGTVVNATGKMQECRFEPLATTAIRVYITANNGAHSKLYEVKVYRQ